MILFIYFLISVGFRDAGFGLYSSATWPVIVGRMVARRALQEGLE